ncbi:hypothetical protein [Altererythrobacter sp. Root672]|uniref:hypothetical protein n=1 Tax=Altererythrobacter sp. Root672 TaxID=1736584 RepID=UPI0006F97DD7|nr:hypothetical protein [Altererythrobacter sp. Root672]KRA83865.1 hypothetical protein ASD76_07600 [Altererythrobacter sp. Root672]
MKIAQAMAALLFTSSLAVHAQAPNAPVQTNEIVVQIQRLSATGLRDTTLVMERRDYRIEIEMRADGTFRSSLNGLFSDRGKWRVDGERVCFDGIYRESYCSSNLVGKRPGDAWDGVSGLDGLRYKVRLVAGT